MTDREPSSKVSIDFSGAESVPELRMQPNPLCRAKPRCHGLLAKGVIPLPQSLGLADGLTFQSLPSLIRLPTITIPRDQNTHLLGIRLTKAAA